MSTYKIGKIYNCDSATISKVLHKYNIIVTKLIDLPMEDISKKYQNGMNTYELAKEYNCSQSVISRRLNKYGINVNKLITIPIDEIREKYTNGMSLKSIADEYDCDKSVIKNRLQKHNIDIKLSGRHKSHLILSNVEIYNKYCDGITLTDIAQECGCGRETIKRRLIKYNIKIRSTGECRTFNLPDEEICNKYQNGISVYEIAKQYDCDSNTIKRRLLKNGIKIRSISEASITIDSKKRRSAAAQGILYDEWKGFSEKQKYCYLFNLPLKEAIRLYFDNKCFMDNEPENNGKSTSVHHVNFDKRCGCNATQLCIFVPVKAKWNSIFNGNKDKNRWYWYTFLMIKIFIEHPNYFVYHIPVWGMNELEYNYSYVFEKFRR